MWQIFNLISSINDSEHPLVLEEFNTVEQVYIQTRNPETTVAMAFITIVCTAAWPPLLASHASFIHSSAFQDGHAHYNRDSWLKACSEQAPGAKEQIAAALENPPTGDCDRLSLEPGF